MLISPDIVVGIGGHATSIESALARGFEVCSAEPLRIPYFYELRRIDTRWRAEVDTTLQ
jgi:hypothetical protein